MVDDTYGARYIGSIRYSGPSELQWLPIASGEVIYPGDFVAINTSTELVAVNSTDAISVAGVMEAAPGQDLDTAYTVTTGKRYPFYPKGQNTVVYVKLQTTYPSAAVAGRIGTPLSLGTEDGKCSIDATTDGSTSKIKCGRLRQYTAGDGTYDKIVLATLSD